MPNSFAETNKNLNPEFIKTTMKMTCALLTVNEAKLLFSLAKNSPDNCSIIEIGSYKGGSTIFLAKGAQVYKKNKVYAIDPHKYGLLIRGWGNLLFEKDTLPLFMENIKNSGVEEMIEPIAETSEKAEKMWRNKKNSIGFLWIDGDHDYEHVKLDFLLWEKYLVNGGVIAFHDVNDSKNLAPEVGQYIKKQDGPERVFKKNILGSERFIFLGSVDSISYARKIKEISKLNLAKNEIFIYFLRIIILLRIRILLEKTYRETDQFLGQVGSILKKNAPFLYSVIKNKTWWKITKK